MTKKFRKVIRRLHHEVDGFIGRIFFRHEPINYRTTINDKVIQDVNFHAFTYSQQSHFKRFHSMPIHVGQSPATCDLKVYQDLFMYTFIKNNIRPGARILEIGGGESRVIAELKNDYDFWNLDKLEGVGFGPTDLWEKEGFVLVRDNIGAYSCLLPDEHFDLVYSISTVEHFPHDEMTCSSILTDIQRILKPGGISVHCIDALLFEDHLIIHPLAQKVLAECKGAQTCLDHEQIRNDEDLWSLSRYAYYTRWYHLTKKRMRDFGLPFSINLLWKKEVSPL